MCRAFWHWGLVVCVGLGSVLPGSPVQAKNIDMVFSTTLCGQPYKLLRRYVQRMVDRVVEVKPRGRRGTVFASGLVDMFAMMQEAGIPKEEVDRIFNLIRPNADEPIQRDPVFAQLLEGLREIQLSRKFVVCVLDEQCKLLDAFALFIHPGLNRVKVVDGAILLLTKSEWINPRDVILTRSVDPQLAKIIVAAWDAHHYFFHEAMHYVDYQLLLRWVDANHRLKQAGQATSEWYKKYVKQLRRATYIAQEFELFFLELRGVYIDGILLERQLKKQGVRLSKRQRAQIQDWLRARFIISLKDQGGRFFTQAEFLGHTDVFAYVLSVRESMMQDIVRAEKLSTP